MLNKTKTTQTREDEVSRQIEQAILDQRLPPGTKLKEVALAKFFGVSRGLIRKVLSRLASSKLVQQTPNRGSRVASPSAKEGQDLFAARRAIESAIIDLLVSRADPDMIRHLQKLVTEEQTAYQSENQDKALSLSIDFHRQLASIADNRVLQDYLDDIIRRTPLVMLAHAGSQQETNCLNQEHQDIVSAIEAGDADTAKQLMTHHLSHIESKVHYREETPVTDISQLLGAGETDS